MRLRATAAAACAAMLAVLGAPTPATAQGVKLAVGDFGIGIGDVPRLDGLRINFRDRDLMRVRGVNLTVWQPHPDADGVVQGIALGLPLAGGAEVSGLALGAGIAATRSFSGIAIAPLGMGAGESLRGIAVGGLGIGTGGSASGLLVGGLGAGVGGSFTGIAAGGLGVGAGRDVRGILVGGLGVGAGGDLEGLAIGGLGVGVGGELRGAAISLLGVGAPRICGVVLTGFGAGASEMRGFVLAPAFFRVQDSGSMKGVSVSAFNQVLGTQRGLTIGVVNIAEELHGLQVGLINVARNKRSFRVLPLLNYSR